MQLLPEIQGDQRPKCNSSSFRLERTAPRSYRGTLGSPATAPGIAQPTTKAPTAVKQVAIHRQTVIPSTRCSGPEISAPKTATPMATPTRSEEHTSELQSRFGISYDVFCLQKKQHISLLDITSSRHSQRPMHPISPAS